MTEHPTAQWTAQQIVEAFRFDTAPSYLLRDRDGIYGDTVQRRINSRWVAMAIADFLTVEVWAFRRLVI